MKKFISFISIVLILNLITACSNEDIPEPVNNITERTFFIYMPWSSNLTGYFYQNLKDLETCIEEMGNLQNERIIVFFSNSPSEATFFEISCDKGECQRTEIKQYLDHPFTTPYGLTEIITDVVDYSPSKKYSMIIGCHGMGWLPVNNSRALYSLDKYHYDYENEYMTRYFGGTSSEYQTDISTLSYAIASNGIIMDYILFDDCYMASIEVAYELKDVSHYLIASTCEVMAYGMPYQTMGKHLIGEPDYKKICEDFYEFYSNYAMPCGTLSVTDLSQIEDMASLMKEINTGFIWNKDLNDEIQKLDGYSPTIFYDFGDYVEKLIKQNNEISTIANVFEYQLNRLIPYKVNTEYFYSASRGRIKINSYSGITTSDPSINTRSVDKSNTKWYYATH